MNAPNKEWPDREQYSGTNENTAPGAWLPVVTADGVRSMKWGLIPQHQRAHESPDHFRRFNSRTDNVTKLYARQLRTQRGVVLVSGFFEWKAGDVAEGEAAKQPYYMYRADGAPLRLAAVFDVWHDAEGRALHTVSLLTADARSTKMAWLHDRIPVLLGSAETAARWIHGTEAGNAGIGSEAPDMTLLQPSTPPSFRWHRVHARMNKLSFRGPTAEEWKPPPVKRITSFFTAKARPSSSQATSETPECVTRAQAKVKAEVSGATGALSQATTTAGPNQPDAEEAAGAGGVCAYTQHVREITGDLLESDAQYIVHQTNCTSRTSRGLSKLLFHRFPYADVYRDQGQFTGTGTGTGTARQPGTIEVRGQADCDRAAPGAQRAVIAIFGQYRPGASRGASAKKKIKAAARASPFARAVKREIGTSSGGVGSGEAQLDDTAPQRLKWFCEGLRQVERLPSLTSVAFPHRIGCGLGGGDWAQYRKAIGAFAARSGAQVTVVKLSPPGATRATSAAGPNSTSRSVPREDAGTGTAQSRKRCDTGCNWACAACTFQNCNPEGLACEICGTPRFPVRASAENNASKAAKRQKR